MECHAAIISTGNEMWPQNLEYLSLALGPGGTQSLKSDEKIVNGALNVVKKILEAGKRVTIFI